MLVSNFEVLKKNLPEKPDMDFIGARYREATTFARLFWEHPFDPKFPRHLYRIKMPTLIVWGRRTRSFPSARLPPGRRRFLTPRCCRPWRGPYRLPGQTGDAQCYRAISEVTLRQRYLICPSWPGGAAHDIRDFAKHPKSREAGWWFKDSLSLNHHPVCAASEASRLFLNGAACPSWPGGAKRRACLFRKAPHKTPHLEQHIRWIRDKHIVACSNHPEQSSAGNAALKIVGKLLQVFLICRIEVFDSLPVLSVFYLVVL